MPPPMRSVALVAGDFVRTGGMDMPNFALAKRSAERDMDAHLVAYRIADELNALPRVTWHRVPKPLGSYLAGSPLLDLLGRRVARRVHKQAGRVIVNGGNCQVADINWVHYVHAAYEPHAKHQNPLRGVKAAVARELSLARERTAIRSAQLVLVNSARTGRDLVERLQVEPARIRVVYYGIDAERFRPPSEGERARARQQLALGSQRQLVFIGALADRRKGFDTLYSAWQELCRERDWDCNLLVVGHGAELDRWKARASSDGLAERVRFLGFRRDVPDILAACDALVAPTRYEAFGLGVLEALCSGLPALVSADAGVAERYPEALHELLLQDANSVSELRQRLRAWRSDAERLASSTRALSAELRQRTWDVMADEILGLAS